MRNNKRIMCCLVLLLVCATALAMPNAIAIRGQLLTPDGFPLTGARAYSVKFYDAETGGTQLGTDITGVTTLSDEGLFSFSLTPPPDILVTNNVWYALAVDSNDTTGIDEADWFTDRVKVESVPFALQAGEALSVDAGVIGDGSVTNAEIEALAGVTAPLQAQLNAKADATEVVSNASAIAANTNAIDANAATVATDQAAQDTAIAANATAVAAKADINNVLPRVGEAYVLVSVTSDAATNGANLLTAYASAKALTPQGIALSATNRAIVIVPPGRYDLGTGALLMDTEFVDVIGLTTARRNQYIYGTTNGSNTGVLMQTANDVCIENLLVECTRSTGDLIGNTADPASYFPDSNKPDTVLRNCEFKANDANALSMRLFTEYSGTYENCSGGYAAFGGYGGTASGTFTNCSGGTYAFGGLTGTASGTFDSCTGGTSAFGGGGTASGNFTNCTGGNNAFGGTAASGTFVNCTGGTSAFCPFGSASGGKFYFCAGGTGSFTTSGSPTVFYCVRDGVEYP